MTTGDDCGFPLTMWTVMVESLLKPLQFRQETRLLSPVSDIFVDFGVPKGEGGVETAQNDPRVLLTDIRL